MANPVRRVAPWKARAGGIVATLVQLAAVFSVILLLAAWGEGAGAQDG